MDRAKKKGVTRQKRLEYPDDIHISESLPQGKTNKQTNKQNPGSSVEKLKFLYGRLEF